MRFYLSLLVFISLAATSAAAVADEKITGHPEPLQNELLPSPIILNDCPGVKITEWRGSRNKSYTTPSHESIALINNICKRSVGSFVDFVSKKGYNLKLEKPLRQTVSIIPWNAFDSDGREWGPGDGDDYRNLQDNSWRFYNRSSKDKSREQLGWTDREHNHVLVLNDVFNNENSFKPFIEILSHEFFHAMSNYYGLFDIVGHEQDEVLADEFGKFINSTGL